MSFDDIFNDILHLDKPISDEYWADKGQIPLFSRKPFYDYGSEIPDSEVVTLDAKRYWTAQNRRVYNMLVCATTGVGKTRFVKNLVKGFYKAGYRILFIEPKSTEMYNANKIATCNLFLYD